MSMAFGAAGMTNKPNQADPIPALVPDNINLEEIRDEILAICRTMYVRPLSELLKPYRN
jgi:hypothetical protein